MLCIAEGLTVEVPRPVNLDIAELRPGPGTTISHVTGTKQEEDTIDLVF